MYCPECKKEVETEKYCIFCGADLAPEIKTEELQVKEPAKGEAEDKLPKVDETNVGDITLLLMSGIKTVAVMGNLVHDTQPKKQAGQELNIDRPALEAGHKPEENVQQTI